MAGVVEGADQSPNAAELCALHNVIEAIAAVGKKCPYFILIDNLNVVTQMRLLIDKVPKLPKHTFGKWLRIARLIEGYIIEVYWNLHTPGGFTYMEVALAVRHRTVVKNQLS